MPENKENVLKINAVRAKAGKYLTFKLGDEIYGLEILKVQEIIGMMKITSVPKMPEFIRGVINLRGKIIPVVNLRLKFNMPRQGDTVKSCIIVVQIRLQEKIFTMGILVDEVSEVLNISQEQIDDPPSFGSTVDVEFIMGMGKIAQKVVILLDIDNVITKEEADIFHTNNIKEKIHV